MSAEGIEIYHLAGIKFTKNGPPVTGDIDASAIFVFSAERVVIQEGMKFVLKENPEPLVKRFSNFVWGSVVLLTEPLAEFDACTSCLGHSTKQ